MPSPATIRWSGPKRGRCIGRSGVKTPADTTLCFADAGGREIETQVRLISDGTRLII